MLTIPKRIKYPISYIEPLFLFLNWGSLVEINPKIMIADTIKKILLINPKFVIPLIMSL